MRVVFFGTPEFSAKVLDALFEAKINIVGIISKPDKPQGRHLKLTPTPVKALASEKHPEIPLWQPEKVSDPLFAPTLEALKPDLFVVVAYGEILKEHLLTLPRKGCINVHTSLLPKLRGAAPIQRAIMQGEGESGVTIIYLVKQMDAGDILSQRSLEVGPDMTFGELEEAILKLSIPILLEAISSIEAGEAPRVPQDPEKATFAPKVEAEECEVKWERDAAALHNLIRGSNPYPGAWCWAHIKGQKVRLKLFRTRLVSNEGKAGEIVSFGKEGWRVACSQGALEILEVQPEGKRRMSTVDFMRGVDRSQIVL